MNTYIALLRGINVSGHKIIKMELLRKVLAELHFENVATYIQSGNIIFQSDATDPRQLEKQIALLIYKHFGFDVPVMIVTPESLKKVVANNPYPKTEDPAQPYVAFLSEIPAPSAIASLKAVDFGKDSFVNIDNTMYLHYADSAGNTKLSNAAIENKLKLKATSRNWKTINKLIELSLAIK